MKYILNTHTFIWANSFPEKLSPLALKTIENNAANLYLSAASVWEIAIKINNGKLQFDIPLKQYINIGCKLLQCRIYLYKYPIF
ncbi:MAG: hypothetical protein KIT64_04120 [Chitinophagaceae bacterium]|nr:hypothetical protein [Chitinophagaceae bacterium]